MASGIGTAIIDFGAYPGASETSVVVSGISGISATSNAEAFIMGDDSTTDHAARDHRYLGLYARFTCGAPTVGTGFTIYGTSTERLQGTYKIRYVWSD